MSFFQNFFKNILPVVKADEAELVDPQKTLRERCSVDGKCPQFKLRLDTCNDRVNSRTNTEENCFEELVDYIECVDHCVAKSLFDYLK